MERLFNEDGSYTEQGDTILGYLADMIEEVMDKYPDVDVRDLKLVALDAANDAATSMILDRKG